MAAPILFALMLVAIIVVGNIAREFVKNSKEHRNLFRKDLEDLTERMDQLESNMTELKELVADTIIAQE